MVNHYEKKDVSFAGNVVYSLLIHVILLYFVTLLHVQNGSPSIAPPTVTFVQLGYAAEIVEQNRVSSQRIERADSSEEHAREVVSDQGTNNKAETAESNKSPDHKIESEVLTLAGETKVIDNELRSIDKGVKEEPTVLESKTTPEKVSTDTLGIREGTPATQEMPIKKVKAVLTELETSVEAVEEKEVAPSDAKSIQENPDVLKALTGETGEDHRTPIEAEAAISTEVSTGESEMPAVVEAEAVPEEEPPIMQIESDNNSVSDNAWHEYAFHEYEKKESRLTIHKSLKEHEPLIREAMSETSEIEPAGGGDSETEAAVEISVSQEEALTDEQVMTVGAANSQNMLFQSEEDAVTDHESSGGYVGGNDLAEVETEIVMENANSIIAGANEDQEVPKEGEKAADTEVAPGDEDVVPPAVETEVIAEEFTVAQERTDKNTKANESWYKYALGENEKKESHLSINTSIEDHEPPIRAVVPIVADEKTLKKDEEPDVSGVVETETVSKEIEVPQAVLDGINEVQEETIEVAKVAAKEIAPVMEEAPVEVEPETITEERPTVTKFGTDNNSTPDESWYKYAFGEYEKKDKTHLAIHASIEYSENKHNDELIESQRVKADEQASGGRGDIENDISHEDSVIQEIIIDAEQNPVMDILTPDKNRMPSREEYVVTNHYDIKEPKIVKGAEEIILASIDENFGISLPQSNDIEVELLMESSKGTIDIEFIRKTHPMDNGGNSARNRREVDVTRKFENISILKDAGLKQVYTLLKAEKGAYVVSLMNNGEENLKVDLMVRLYEGTGDEQIREIREVRFKEYGDRVRIMFLMPEAIFWDDEEMFTGIVESSKEITKFNEETGLVWKEKKNYVKGF